MTNKNLDNRLNNRDKNKLKYKSLNVNMKSQTKYMKASYQNPYNSFWELQEQIQVIWDFRDKVYKLLDRTKIKKISNKNQKRM